MRQTPCQVGGNSLAESHAANVQTHEAKKYAAGERESDAAAEAPAEAPAE